MEGDWFYRGEHFVCRILQGKGAGRLQPFSKLLNVFHGKGKMHAETFGCLPLWFERKRGQLSPVNRGKALEGLFS